MQKEGKKWISLILIGLFCFNILAWLAVYDLSREHLEVVFFDVGQGDATLIKTSQGHQILIDGGPGSAIIEKLGKEMPFWDRTIDLIVLTHPHSDHLRGLLEVLERYKIKSILWTGVLYESALSEEWQRVLEEREEIDVYIARAGQTVAGSGMLIEILHPFESFDGQTVSNLDNTSVAARLVFGDNAFLFTGDAFISVEKELLKRGLNINSDVLQVGHHGSRTSSSEEFVLEVSPQIAVISAGRNNRYGHPHQETLDTLAKYGIDVFRTDLHGDIKIISDGKNLKLKYEISTI